MNQSIQPPPIESCERSFLLDPGLGSPSPLSPYRYELSCQERVTNNVDDTVAMVLAGGMGSRLQPLTQQRCKPAVPFGASCKIIDFTLSNCINSGIRRVGVLTQYKQHSLIQHIQEDWNILHRDGNEIIDVLPAPQRNDDQCYRGTADAVAQNLQFLKKIRSKHTLILAGDHIYKADYRRLIQHHIDCSADVSIACCNVPAAKAHQFGIVNIDDKSRIVKFTEKPSIAANRKMFHDVANASMGIYLFNTELLIECMEQDLQDHKSTHDFGQDIVPRLITDSDVVAYQFDQAQTEHYWRDVGTIDAYYETNMQLLDSDGPIDLHSSNWPIHTRLKNACQNQPDTDSSINQCIVFNCIIASGCVLREASLHHSILFTGASVNEQSDIENSLILPGAVIGKRCRIRNAIIDSGVRIEDNTEIGFDAGDDATRYRVSDDGVVVVSNCSAGLSSTVTASGAHPQHLAYV